MSAGRNAGSLPALWRGHSVSGGLGVALPCASSRRSRLLLEVLDVCSYVCRRRSPRERAIIREVNETVFALNFLETGVTVGSESCEQVEHSILSTDLASPALCRLHFVISDLRPPSVTESGSALRRLLASRAIGGHPSTSDDPAPGVAGRVPVAASCSTTGCLTSSLFCVTAEWLNSFLLGCILAAFFWGC